MGTSIDEFLQVQYLQDAKIIREELEPLMFSLQEKEVNNFSVAMFLSSYLKELLKEMDSKTMREIVMRNILD